MKVEFWVSGIPKALSVGSTVRAGSRLFQQRRNSAWATRVGIIGRRMRPRTLPQGPVVFSATFYLPLPKRRANVFPLTRPDVDNLVHKLSDQFNGILYRDDSQIVDFRASKRYAEDDKVGVEITVETLG